MKIKNLASLVLAAGLAGGVSSAQQAVLQSAVQYGQRVGVTVAHHSIPMRCEGFR